MLIKDNDKISIFGDISEVDLKNIYEGLEY